MKRSEYLDLKKKIEARYKRDMEALERVWAIVNEYSDSAPTSKAVNEIVEQTASDSKEKPENHRPEQNGLVERFSLRREIENILSEFDVHEAITQGEVRQRLEARFPGHEAFMHSASVSSALRHIAQAGDLVLVSKGTGSEPNRYRLPEHNTNNRDQEELGELRE